jgi:assimilatory nitrate reductase catalytic subunit
MPSLDNITWERLERESSVTYPCDAPDKPGNDIVFGDGFPTPSGRGKLVPVGLVPPAEEPDDEYPLVLTTGRVIYHYLSGNQTRRTPFLFQQAPCPWVEIHEATAEKLGVKDGDWMTVRTRRGEMTAPALVVRSIRPDTIFIPYHYPGNEAANILTNPVLEPMNKIPEYKVCAAAAVKAERPPEWARDFNPELLKVARASRRNLPSSGAKVGPRVR